VVTIRSDESITYHINRRSPYYIKYLSNKLSSTTPNLAERLLCLLKNETWALAVQTEEVCCGANKRHVSVRTIKIRQRKYLLALEDPVAEKAHQGTNKLC
jgi:hypothetical protein